MPTDTQLKWMLEEAAEQGAMRALKRIGLDDESAIHDVRDLRDWLRGWRKTKSDAWNTIVTWTTRGTILLILGALAATWWGRR